MSARQQPFIIKGNPGDAHLLYWANKAGRFLKFKAFIVSFCFLVYIMELAALPVYCMPVPEKKSDCASSCTRKAADSPCKKPPKDCSNTSNCCVNCPLCYVMTITSAAMPGKSSGTVKREYPHYQSNYLFIYYTTAWKPPNGC